MILATSYLKIYQSFDFPALIVKIKALYQHLVAITLEFI
jgi:hypothetical protein